MEHTPWHPDFHQAQRCRLWGPVYSTLNARCIWVGSGEDCVHTANKQDQSLLVSGPKPPLQGGVGPVVLMDSHQPKWICTRVRFKPYRCIHARAVWSTLNKTWFVHLDSPFGLGSCKSSFKVFYGQNKGSLVPLGYWFSSRWSLGRFIGVNAKWTK